MFPNAFLLQLQTPRPGSILWFFGDRLQSQALPRMVQTSQLPLKPFCLGSKKPEQSHSKQLCSQSPRPSIRFSYNAKAQSHPRNTSLRTNQGWALANSEFRFETIGWESHSDFTWAGIPLDWTLTPSVTQHFPFICFCLQKGDENDIRSINYYPESASFDLRYYPYYGKLTHVSCILFPPSLIMGSETKGKLPGICENEGAGGSNRQVSCGLQ